MIKPKRGEHTPKQIPKESEWDGEKNTFENSIATARRKRFVQRDDGTYFSTSGDHTTSIKLDRRPQTKVDRKFK